MSKPLMSSKRSKGIHSEVVYTNCGLATECNMIRPTSSITLPNIICNVNYDETVSGLMDDINGEKDKSPALLQQNVQRASRVAHGARLQLNKRAGAVSDPSHRHGWNFIPAPLAMTSSCCFSRKRSARCGARNLSRAQATGLFKQYLMPSNVKYIRHLCLFTLPSAESQLVIDVK